MMPRPVTMIRRFPYRSPRAPDGRSMITRAAGRAPTSTPTRNALAPKWRPYSGNAGTMIEIPIMTKNTVPDRTATVRRTDCMERRGILPRLIKVRRSEIDGAGTVPYPARAFLGGRDQQVPLRLRRDDEELLSPPGLRNQDELHLPSFHRRAGLRMQVVIPHIPTTVDKGTDLDLSFLRACENFAGESRVGHLWGNRLPGKKPLHPAIGRG